MVSHDKKSLRNDIIGWLALIVTHTWFWMTLVVLIVYLNHGWNME